MDYRDKLAIFGPLCPPHQFDEKKMELTFEIDDGEDDEPKVHTLKCSYEVCDACDGKGKYVNPSIDAHGISEDEFNEDPEFREDYFSGRYDVTCRQCKGKRVFPTPSETESEAYKVWRDWIESEEIYQAQCAAERRMGC